MSLEHRQTIRWRCNQCGKEENQNSAISEGCEGLRACIPRGWTNLGVVHICPAHNIVIKADHKTVFVHNPR